MSKKIIAHTIPIVKIKVDVSIIPEHMRDSLARSVLEIFSLCLVNRTHTSHLF